MVLYVFESVARISEFLSPRLRLTEIFVNKHGIQHFKPKVLTNSLNEMEK